MPQKRRFHASVQIFTKLYRKHDRAPRRSGEAADRWPIPEKGGDRRMGHGSVGLEGKTPKAALFCVFCFLLFYNIKRIKSKTENNKILHKDFKLDKAYPPKIAPCGDFFKGVNANRPHYRDSDERKMRRSPHDVILSERSESKNLRTCRLLSRNSVRRSFGFGLCPSLRMTDFWCGSSFGIMTPLFRQDIAPCAGRGAGGLFIVPYIPFPGSGS